MSGKVEKLWTKRAKRGPMDPTEELRVVRRTGIETNADWGGRRQITIIEKERWDAMLNALGGVQLDPSARRANVMVSGCDLADSRHHILQLGGVRIEIVGETRPCERMDEAHQGLRRAMAAPWNGGAYGIILDDGAIRVGDAVRLLPPSPIAGLSLAHCGRRERSRLSSTEDLMADKRAKDVGSDSPASKEAAEQTRSGIQGSPRGEGEKGGSDRQPAQSSGRSGPGPEAQARKGYDEGSSPSEQGDGSPSPERVAESDSMQGESRASSPRTETARGEDEATVHEK